MNITPRGDPGTALIDVPRHALLTGRTAPEMRLRAPKEASASTGSSPTIANVRPAERGGPKASNRLDLQKNWTLCHLLELHGAGTDYVLVCDYHDDVVVLEPIPSGGERYHFYQVKSASSPWSLKALVRRPAARRPKKKAAITTSETEPRPTFSILGKLFRHTLDFKDRVAGLHLISNAPYKIRLSTCASATERQEFRFHELHADAQMLATDSMTTEHGVRPATFPTETRFVVTGLSPLGHDDVALGRLTNFFDTVIQKKGVDVPAAYRALFDEIRRRSNNEAAWPTLAELVAKKGIRKDWLDGLLRSLSVTADYKQEWERYLAELTACEVPFWQREKIRGHWVRYRTQRMDQTNEVLQRRREAVCLALAAELERQHATLRSLLDAVVQRVGTDDVHSAEYIHAMTLLEMTDNDHPAIQEARS